MKYFKSQKNKGPALSERSESKGFSLIELMVSIGIFTVVMTVAIGAFMTSSNGAKKSKALRVAMDNVNFAMDNISRDLRMGYAYADNNPISQISFVPYNGVPPKVYFRTFTPPGTGKNTRIERCENSISNTTCTSLTAEEVNITKLEFVVSPDPANTSLALIQPSVYIVIEGEVSTSAGKESFDLHTLASQRNAK